MADQHRPDTPDTSPSGTPDATDRSAAGVRFLAFLEERGGVLVSGQREIGRTMGWSKSWTNEVLHDLAAAGLVKLSTRKSGTVVQLLPKVVASIAQRVA
jgi:DNA-binding MarR family transcriptional regulator